MSVRNTYWFHALLFVVTTATVVGGFTYGCSDGGGPDPCIEGGLESDTLEAFSDKCNDAIHLDVPAFDCDDGGTPIPTTNENFVLIDGGLERFCDRPNVLNHVCDPDSTFQVVAQNDEAIAVALCRKQNADAGKYKDIAVIQYNKVNGATCFYQAIGKDLPAAVTAPIDGNGTGKVPWLNPSDVAELKCVHCHDNGPFIRSPYLAQLRTEPTNRLPGTSDTDTVWGPRYGWNLTQPYTFVGNDFQTWKVYKVSVEGVGSACTTCHRMGLATTFGEFGSPFRGTSRRFARLSTEMDQAHKNAHSTDSPIWMKPDQIFYDAGVEDEALAVEACAEAIATEGTLPPGCQAVQFGQGNTCPPAVSPSVIHAPALDLVNNRR